MTFEPWLCEALSLPGHLAIPLLWEEERLDKETYFGRVRFQNRGDAGYQTHVSKEGTALTGPEQTEAAQLRNRPQQFTSTKIKEP